jgi:hypothetical protein
MLAIGGMAQLTCSIVVAKLETIFHDTQRSQLDTVVANVMVPHSVASALSCC